MTQMPEPPREPGERDWAFALEYARSESTPRQRAVQCALGAVMACGAVLGSVLLSLGTNSAYGMIMLPLTIVAVLAILAFSLRRIPARRALAAGVLTGIGVALLLDGLCWAVILNSRIGG
jgi:Na+/H+ antiporter NhaC